MKFSELYEPDGLNQSNVSRKLLQIRYDLNERVKTLSHYMKGIMEKVNHFNTNEVLINYENGIIPTLLKMNQNIISLGMIVGWLNGANVASKGNIDPQSLCLTKTTMLQGISDIRQALADMEDKLKEIK